MPMAGMSMSEKEYNFTIHIKVQARKFWKVYVPWAIGISLGAMLLALTLVDVVIMPGIVGMERGTVKVPPVHGLSLEEGREKLFGVGLLTEIKSREYDSRVPDSVIISQTPEEGAKVKKGRRILVVVSRGMESAAVPEVQSLTERQAKTELRKAGFTSGDVRREFNDKVAADKVIGADPASGTMVSREVRVDLIVSRGSRATSVEMPNIVGEPLDDARKKIEESGLRVGTVTYKSAPSLSPGIVISQSISPGEKIPLESSVEVTVSKPE
jgi:serine/threonine-protein kinase